MRLTIFGASGGTGGLLVQQALRRGDHVTAVFRSPQQTIADHPRLHTVVADVLNPAEITAAIQSADAVLSAIGTRDSGPTTVRADAALSITKAMETVDVRRFLLVSNSARIAGPGDDWFTRFVVKPLILRPLLRHSLDDMAAAEQITQDSALDWTIVRAPRLTDKAAKGSYRAAVERNVTFGVQMTRGDLATSMLDLIADRSSSRKHVNVAN